MRRATILLHCFLIIKIFLSTLSLRRATCVIELIQGRLVFLSTLSLRRATAHYDNYNLHCTISIHALLAESDLREPATRRNDKFLSTLSLRRATCFGPAGTYSLDYFYPRSPCGERPESCWLSHGQFPYFYPRSPCGERQINLTNQTNLPGISIHALLAESDKGTLNLLDAHRVFLSTLSLRRATWVLTGGLNFDGYFYPRSPCGERQLTA